LGPNQFRAHADFVEKPRQLLVLGGREGMEGGREGRKGMVECFLERHMPVGRDGGKERKAYIYVERTVQ